VLTGCTERLRAWASRGRGVVVHLQEKSAITVRKALPEHHMPGVIYPDGVQDELGDIDAVQADLRPVYLITTLPCTRF
jgi:hypothetical protein